MKHKKRKIYTVSFEKDSKMWLAESACGGFRFGHHSKIQAVSCGRFQAKSEWNHGKPSQLVIKGKNGRIQTEYTYGKDPRRYRG